MTHTEYAAGVRVSTPCTAATMTFGGRCLNCGYRPTPYCMECETPMHEARSNGHIVVACPSCGFSEVVI